MAELSFLPQAQQAVVDLEKLREYCRNPAHPRGRHKARVFASALGATSDNAEELKDAILEAASSQEARQTGLDRFGVRYVLDFEWRREDRFAVVRTLWIVRSDDGLPHLTSCFVR